MTIQQLNKTNKKISVNEKNSLNLISTADRKTSDHSNSNSIIFNRQIVWRNVIILLILHLAAVYSYFFLALNPRTHWTSILYVDIIGRLSGIGILAGAHRLWSHRSYKAKLPLRILLMLLQTMALQNDIYEWCRDHRVHHKFSETDADPHNSKRGFFFAHIGWLLLRKHPDVTKKGKTVDMSDIWSDTVVRFQRRFYIPLVIIFWAFLPIYTAHILLGVTKMDALMGAVVFRYVWSLHCSWLVNSAAHMYGNRPYDTHIEPRNNRFVTYMSMGEGYHNYHHTFPWDYSANELSWKCQYSPATAFIDLCAYFGQAYDLRKPDEELVRKRIARTGNCDYTRSGKRFTKMKAIKDCVRGVFVSTSFLWFTILVNCLMK